MNRIKKVMQGKGIDGIRPTNTLLEKMGITLRIWNKWVENKKDPHLDQLPLVAEFLNCQVSELLEIPQAHETESC